jgi:pimeloyl-ACP methyl ester carboxylesterase
LRLRPVQARGVAAVAWLPAVLRRRGPLAVLPKFDGFDVTDEEMKKQNPALAGLPLPGVASMLDLAAVVRRDLPFLKMPILVAHGEKDRTVPLEDSLEIVGTIGSDVIERLWLRSSGHLIAIDVERAALTEAVGRLFAKYLPDAGGGTDKMEASS